MAITEMYFNPDLATGSNNGTSEANAWQTWGVITFAAGERVNAKNPASAFTPGADISATVSGSDLQPVIFRGYGSTIGDGTKFQFDMEANTLTISGEANIFQDIDATGTEAFAAVVNISGDLSRLHTSKVVNTGTGANEHYAIQLTDASVVDCYAETNGTDHTDNSESWAIRVVGGSVLRCIVVSTAVGIRAEVSFRSSAICDNLIYEKGSSADAGVSIANHDQSGFCVVSGNTIDGHVNAIEIRSVDAVVGAAEPIIISGNILSNATVGIENLESGTRSSAVIVDGNAFYNCTTDTDLDDVPIIAKVSLSADPYTDAANDDYTLNNTAGGGADVRDALQIGAGV